MIFGYFTLFVALVISAVAAYYSIVGLTAIFSAAVIPILIMGASLEVGKVTAAVWLKMNWHRASLLYKFYLVPAVAFLMLLTSMGIFGFLSKAHSDQSLVSGDSMAKVAVYDEKIKIERDNIEASRKALKQMDESVDQVMGRSSDERGAEKAVAIRRAQQKERGRLAQDIAEAQKKITAFNEEAAPLRAEFRKVESEVGPIKYIAALVYGDNPDQGVLEKAVRLVIIIIVLVFDPLALVLILAAQQSIKWIKEEKEPPHWLDHQADELTQAFNTTPIVVPVEPPVSANNPIYEFAEEINEPDYPMDDGPLTEEQIEQIKESAKQEGKDPHPAGWMYTQQQHPYLLTPFVHFDDLKPMPSRIAEYQEPVEELHVDSDQPLAEEPQIPAADVDVVDRPGDYVAEPVSKFPKVPETAQRVKTESAPVPETQHYEKHLSLAADNIEGTAVKSSFGTRFPEGADRGEMFLRVDYLPNRLYKFTGDKWIEVDKTKTDSYSYDEQYILFLIEKLQSGEYEIDQLSVSEQELVAEKLEQIKNDKT
jgi:hypothetical protein